MLRCKSNTVVYKNVSCFIMGNPNVQYWLADNIYIMHIHSTKVGMIRKYYKNVCIVGKRAGKAKSGMMNVSVD